MNKKNLRIQKLWNRGVRDPVVIAKKLGYIFDDLEEGVERVLEGLYALRLKERPKDEESGL